MVWSLFAATRAVDSSVLKFALVSVIQCHQICFWGRINLHMHAHAYIHIVLAGVCRFVGAAGAIDTCEHKSKCRSTFNAQNHQGSFIKYEWKFNASLVMVQRIIQFMIAGFTNFTKCFAERRAQSRFCKFGWVCVPLSPCLCHCLCLCACVCLPVCVCDSVRECVFVQVFYHRWCTSASTKTQPLWIETL